MGYENLISSQLMKGSNTVKDIDAANFIKTYAAHLRKQGKIKMPYYCEFVKTGSYKELSPYDPYWWYTRVAAIARRIYLRQGLGVGRLRNIYGGSYSNGWRPKHHARASGNIIRKCIQQLERIGVVEKMSDGGRRITVSGQRDLDLIAGRC